VTELAKQCARPMCPGQAYWPERYCATCITDKPELAYAAKKKYGWGDRQKDPLYDARWAKASKAYLKAFPWCACGCGRLAMVTDHIRPHKGNVGLFWDANNWQGLSKRCHDAKSAKE